MEIYRDFLKKIRKLTLNEPYLPLVGDILPNLTEYIRLFRKVESKDGFYHVVYGTIKRIVYGFIRYYCKTIDLAYIEADKLSHKVGREDLLELWQQASNINQSRQVDFGTHFLPVTTAEDRAVYDQIDNLYEEFTEKLNVMKKKIEHFDRQEKVKKFSEEHFELALIHTKDLFEFTHIFISKVIMNHIHDIRVSLEEILLRMQNNLKNILAESEENLNILLNSLYDKNKELLVLSRKTHKCSIETAEVDRAIDINRKKIKDPKYEPTITRLEEEIVYWQKRLNEFIEISDPLLTLQRQLEDVEKQEKIYENLKTSELPGSKKCCWIRMGENFKNRKELLKARITDQSRALLTFFCARGTDRVFYTDKIGPYYVDEHKHQVYLFNDGLKLYHQTCEGKLHQVSENVKYYIDECGRYIFDEKGDKIYQSAPCTSQYKLTDSSLLKKVTVDCGHSEKPNRKCQQRIKEANDIEILPSTEMEVDIKGTLTPEVVKYLWDSFGYVLPFALQDVALHHHKNPIHLLAHKLLYHKYTKTIPELEQKKKEAEEYRANIFKERKEVYVVRIAAHQKAVAASRAWKAKQVKRRKPEESDDTEDRAVYDYHISEQERINALNFYNDC